MLINIFVVNISNKFLISIAKIYNFFVYQKIIVFFSCQKFEISILFVFLSTCTIFIPLK
jgi:hypothetical protein